MKLLAVLLLSICLCFPGFACTTFVLQGGDRIYFGRNLDWETETGQVVLNPRNVRKSAFLLTPGVPAKWTAKYGSVTFNQFGREMPFGGMNEAGLVVENMWLDDTKYPVAGSRPEINMLQWIQYQLDNCSTVAEVIGSDKQITLEDTPVRARVHYYVCDAKGDCATIEFLNGAMKVHRDKDLPYHALANDPYDWSLLYLRAHPASAGVSAPLAQADSASRFCRAAARAQEFKPAATRGPDLDYAFDTLEQVRQGKHTVWQIVYDVAARQIQFRTLSNTRMRHVDLKALDFTCNHPSQFADIQADDAGKGALVFHEQSEADQRKYLNAVTSQPSLQAEVGDLTMIIEPLLLTLRGYVCADK